MNNLLRDPRSLTYMGMDVVVAPEFPVLQIRDSFEWCSDAFRREMNGWLLARFGTRSNVPDNQVLVMYGTVLMSPRTHCLLRSTL